MKTILSAAFLSLFSLASANASVYLEYYKDHTCSSSTLSAVKLSTPEIGCGACVTLNSPAKSFHVGAPASQAQLPSDCEIIGYADSGCRGGVNLIIQGPTKAAKCYDTGAFMGTIAKVESVRMLCS